jgi:polar amino acid transport system substrate-binding protein
LLRDKPINYRTLADPYGKRVGVLLGWSYGDDFDAARKSGKIVADDVYADSQNFDKLAQRRLDAVLAIEQVGVHQMQLPRNAGIASSAIYLAENPTHLAFNRNQHLGTVLEGFNRALGELRKNGVYAEIVEKLSARNK